MNLINKMFLKVTFFISTVAVAASLFSSNTVVDELERGTIYNFCAKNYGKLTVSCLSLVVAVVVGFKAFKPSDVQKKDEKLDQKPAPQENPVENKSVLQDIDEFEETTAERPVSPTVGAETLQPEPVDTRTSPQGEETTPHNTADDIQVARVVNDEDKLGERFERLMDDAETFRVVPNRSGSF